MNRRLLIICAVVLAALGSTLAIGYFTRPTTPPPAVRKAAPAKAQKPAVKAAPKPVPPAPIQPQAQLAPVVINNHNVQNSSAPPAPAPQPASVVINNYNIQGMTQPVLTPPAPQPPAPVPQPMPTYHDEVRCTLYQGCTHFWVDPPR